MIGPHARVRSTLLVPSDEVGWSFARQELEARLGSQAVMEAQDARRALVLAYEQRPTLVFVAEPIGDQSAAPLVSSLRAMLPRDSCIVVLANRLNPERAADLFQAGADGCLLWPELSDELVLAVLDVLIQGAIVVCSRTLADAIVPEIPPTPARKRLQVPLAAGERLVLQGLLRGLTYHQLAAREGLPERTVRRTVSRLEHKLAAPSSFLLGLRAWQLGLVEELLDEEPRIGAAPHAAPDASRSDDRS